MLRLMLCILLVAAVPASAIAAKRTMSLSQAQTAAAKGDDANVSAALAMTTDRNTCLNGCGSRGYDDAHCKLYCKPGFCHPDEETPYCVGK